MESEVIQNIDHSKNSSVINDLDNCQANSQDSSHTLVKDEDHVSFKKSTCELLFDSQAYCQVKLDSILKLKDSTIQLLSILDEIQTKVQTKNVNQNGNTNFHNSIKYNLYNNDVGSVSGELDNGALKLLKNHTMKLDAIFIKEEDDDCSIYKRLTRKCQCLNHPNYNDFIIHFNENSKYTTSDIGELIKNMRILRKFLYMGGDNTKNALMFLNEGLMDSLQSEKIDITLGCAHADICNIFDDHSIVAVCISWPCKYRHYGTYVTQSLAAGFLNRLAEIQEGRRYLNYTSKITNDIKKVLRKKSSCLEIDIIDTLNTTLSLLKPTFYKDLTVSYSSKPVYEGIGSRTIKDLSQHRQHMTLDDIFMHLDLLNNYSSFECGKEEMRPKLPVLLFIFKHLLKQYDNSELNIIVTNIVKNLVSKNMTKAERPGTSKGLVLADTETEPILMKNQVCQMPPPKKTNKKIHKAKSGHGVSTNKHCDLSKKKISEWESSVVINGSRRFNEKSVIIVPIENKK